MLPETGFEVHVLRFRATVTSPLDLPRAAGAALRGALFGALRAQFCLAGRGPQCGEAPISDSCPVCFLLAPVDDSSAFGRDVPRPYVLCFSPTAPLRYAPDDSIEFGLATFGRALSHFPYALLGVEEVGRHGFGSGRRGTFRLTDVWSENALSGEQQPVLVRARGATVRPPSLPVNGAHVAAEVARLVSAGADRRVAVELLTPTRLIAERQLVKPDSFSFGVLLARQLERLSALFNRYATSTLGVDSHTLVRSARAVEVVERDLRWCELFRASGRHQRMLPMSGLIGRVVLEGNLAPFLPWLVWGTLTHVGKDAAMGNGMYRLSPA